MNQLTALKILKAGQNVFLTGSAGSGKTYTLNQYIDYLRARRVPVAVTASTGIAATHMKGITIHSWSGIGIKSEMTDQDFIKINRRKIVRERLQDTAVLIIDEVSMLHAKQLDLVNQVLKYVRQSDEAFGGVQVVLAGDFFQLPPVGNRDESNRDKFAFMSKSWLEADFHICYLSEQYRQQETEVEASDNQPAPLTLNNILNQIRRSQVTHQAIYTLENTYTNEVSLSRTRLYTHNFNVDKTNQNELAKLNTDSQRYQGESEGDDKLTDMLKKTVRTNDDLLLKVGAKVMFIKNISELNVFNGTMGEIIGFHEMPVDSNSYSKDGKARYTGQTIQNGTQPDNSHKNSSETGNDYSEIDDNKDNKDIDTQQYPVVRLNTGREVIATPEEWLVENEEGVPLASYRQVPLTLAWAITVHKSQGMTLDAAEIDLSKTFEMGQGYVALSRLKSLSGLKLLGLNDNSLRLDPLARGADKRFLALSDEIFTIYQHIDDKELDKVHQAFILDNGGTINQQAIDAYEANKKRRQAIASKTLHRKTQGGNQGNSLDKTKALFEQGMNIEEIASQRELAQGTIIHHIAQLKTIEPDIDIDNLRPSDLVIEAVTEGYQAVILENDPNDLTEDGQVKLRPIYEYLEGSISYNMIRLALIFVDKQSV